MKPQTAIAQQIGAHDPGRPERTEDDLPLHDLRFRALLGADAWSCLPPAVRRRFSTRLAPGAAITYAGEIVECRRTWVGKLLALLCRLIGAPLPLSDDLAVPAIVTVTEDGAPGGSRRSSTAASASPGRRAWRSTSAAGSASLSP
jgi:hypothetical protein